MDHQTFARYFLAVSVFLWVQAHSMCLPAYLCLLVLLLSDLLLAAASSLHQSQVIASYRPR